MANCEMCGAESESLTKNKISPATLEVCDDCVEMGIPVDDGPTVTNSEPSYSTDESDDSNTDNSTSTQSKTDSMDIGELRADFGSAIRQAREEQDLSLTELSNKLNEKESHLRQIEQENRQPTEELQIELEDFLDVELSIESDFTDYEDEDDESGQKLGDVVDFDI